MSNNSGDIFLLNTTIKNFFVDKEKFDYYKKETENENKQIKELMDKLGVPTFNTDNGLSAKITIQNRESFQEDKLIAKLKQLGIVSPIKTVEVIDYDDLEDVIYNGMLDASILAEFKNTKQITTLKVSKGRDKNE